MDVAYLITYVMDLFQKKITVQQKEHDDPSFSEFDVIFKYKNNELETITNIFPNGYQEQRFPQFYLKTIHIRK